MLRPMRQTSYQCSNCVHDNTKTTKSVQHQHTRKCGCSSQGPKHRICVHDSTHPSNSVQHQHGWKYGLRLPKSQQCLCVPTGCMTRHRRPIGSDTNLDEVLLPLSRPQTSPLCCSSSASQTHKKFGMQAKQCKERVSILALHKSFLVQTFPCWHGRSRYLCMGRNRKWVSEEAVCRTMMRGPRPPSASWSLTGKRSSSAAAPSKGQSPPSLDAKKVQATPVPKSKVSSIQAAITGLGPDPDPVVLSSLRDALQMAKESSKPSPNLPTEPGKSPEARVAEAQARVSRLQAAMDLLGVDNQDAEPLKASVETARRQCSVHPVGERLDSCEKYVERAQGRVERQKKVVEEAQQVLANYDSQLAGGLQDLERLRAEAARIAPRSGPVEERAESLVVRSPPILSPWGPAGWQV